MTNLDPRIGTLNSGKFYAFANGYDQPETVGTLAEVEAALGLRAAPAKARKTALVRTYTVTATLKFAYYTSAGLTSGYEVEVVAKNKAEAISKARPLVRRMGWDRHEGPLTYRAEVGA